MKADRVHQGKFTVILRKEPRGYSVRCVKLPGAISEERTRKEALENIGEAIQGYLEAFPEEESGLKVKNEIVQLLGQHNLQIAVERGISEHPGLHNGAFIGFDEVETSA